MLEKLEFIVSNLKLSITMLKEIEEQEWPSEPEHPICMATDEISTSIATIKAIIARKTSKIHTEKVIDFLKDSKVDYTLLFYLQLPDALKKKSEVLSYLGTICKQMKADFSMGLFYDSVWEYLEDHGFNPITPEKYIVSNKKEEIITEYTKVEKAWRIHTPFFFQTYCMKDGRFSDNVFHITRTTTDGIIRLLEILKIGQFAFNGRVYTACGAFEHVLSSSTLTCQIFDCEIMSDVFKPPKSVDEIREMMLSFPMSITDTMLACDLIEMDDIIAFAVKDRTRQIKGRETDAPKYKVSFHFISNICAPRYMHKRAMEQCLTTCKGRIEEAANCIKGTGELPERLLTGGALDALLTWDFSAGKGNGFTTAFSRKKPTDPFSKMIHADEVVGGQIMDRIECIKDPQDLFGDNLCDHQRLKLLYTQLYTTPKKEMTSYTLEAMERITAELVRAQHTRLIPFIQIDAMSL